MSSQSSSQWKTVINFWICLRVFIAHYRQSPLQAGAIISGIILSVTLLTGVRAINENAIRSYSQTTELLSQQASWYVTPAKGKSLLDEDIYFELRAAGYSNSLAVIEGLVLDDTGERWKIQGSDTIAALSAISSSDESMDENAPSLFDQTLPIAEMIAGEPIVLMSDSQKRRLVKNDTLTLFGRSFHVIGLDERFNMDSRVLMDISSAQSVLEGKNRLSYIALFGDLDGYHNDLQALIGDRAVISQTDNGDSLTALTDSFHLNLTAMSMLAFVVGLFIAYNGIRYSLLKRQKLFTQLQQLGMAKVSLLSALIAELLLLVVVGSIVGFSLGLQLSHWLHPMVSITLEQLYGANILPGIWRWSWLIQAISLTLLASLLACTSLFVQLWNQPLARSVGHYSLQTNAKRVHKIQLGISIAMLSLAAILMPFSQRYQYTMALLGVVVIALPLALPFCLSFLADSLSRFSAKGLLGYQLAETKELVSPMSLAMMAILLAVTANISMNTLVGSFEITLKQWLNARLHADLYLRPAQSEVADVEAFLASKTVSDVKSSQQSNEKEVRITALYKQYYQNGRYAEQPVLFVTKDESTFRQTTIFKQVEENVWDRFFANVTVIINEPMAIKLNISLGDELTFESFSNRVFVVGGIYYDYGNPKNEVLIPPEIWQENEFTPLPLSLGVDIDGDLAEVRQELQENLGLPDMLMFDQQQIKQRAVAIFSRTFSITKVLNSLTMLVAAIGLFSACFMLTQARVAPIARLYSLGVSRRQLATMVMTQMLCIVLLTCVVALPAGALLGYLLINKVTVQAFGWTIGMVWDWVAYAEVILVALFSSLIAVSFPLLRQIRKPLLSSLQSEVL